MTSGRCVLPLLALAAAIGTPGAAFGSAAEAPATDAADDGWTGAEAGRIAADGESVVDPAAVGCATGTGLLLATAVVVAAVAAVPGGGGGLSGCGNVGNCIGNPGGCFVPDGVPDLWPKYARAAPPALTNLECTREWKSGYRDAYVARLTNRRQSALKGGCLVGYLGPIVAAGLYAAILTASTH